GFEFAGRINQHAFDGCAVVGLPAIRLALGEVSFGKSLIEAGDSAGLVEIVGAVGEIDFRRLGPRWVDESNAGGVYGRRNGFVGSRPTAEAVKRVGWLGCGVHLDFGAEASGGEDVI